MKSITFNVMGEPSNKSFQIEFRWFLVNEFGSTIIEKTRCFLQDMCCNFVITDLKNGSFNVFVDSSTILRKLNLFLSETVFFVTDYNDCFSMFCNEYNNKSKNHINTSKNKLFNISLGVNYNKITKDFVPTVYFVFNNLPGYMVDKKDKIYMAASAILNIDVQETSNSLNIFFNSETQLFGFYKYLVENLL